MIAALISQRLWFCKAFSQHLSQTNKRKESGKGKSVCSPFTKVCLFLQMLLVRAQLDRPASNKKLVCTFVQFKCCGSVNATDWKKSPAFQKEANATVHKLKLNKTGMVNAMFFKAEILEQQLSQVRLLWHFLQLREIS